MSPARNVARRQGPRLGPTLQILLLFWRNGEQVSIIRHVLQTVDTRFRYHWDTILVLRFTAGDQSVDHLGNSPKHFWADSRRTNGRKPSNVRHFRRG